ncbi:hypothetical protein [Pseudomonas sp. IT-P12]
MAVHVIGQQGRSLEGMGTQMSSTAKNHRMLYNATGVTSRALSK